MALSSSEFLAMSWRNGKCAKLSLKDGIKTNFNVEEKNMATDSGTLVSFIPSQEVYNLEPIKINIEDVIKMCRDWSYLMKGIRFIVKDEVQNKAYEMYAKNGIIDMLNDSSKTSLNKKPLYIENEENGIYVEIAMEWTNSREEEWHVYTNGLENVEGGTSLTGVKTALTNYFKKKIKGEAAPEIIRKGLTYVINCKVPNPSFSNQTKTKVNTPELRGFCQKATTKMLENYERRNKEEFDKILDLLLKEVRAEAAAEKARMQILEASKDIENEKKKKIILADKLKDCQNHGYDSGSVLAICEGEAK